MAKQRHPRSLLWKAVENCKLPTYLLDETWTLRFFNQAFSETLGPSLRELEGVRLQGDAVPALPPQYGWLAAALLPPVDLRENDQGCFLLPGLTPEGSAPQYQAHWIRFSSEDATCYLITLHLEDDNWQPTPLTRKLHEDWLQARRDYIDELPPFPLLGDSLVAESLREQVKMAQQFNGPLEIVAPPGSGDEEIARYIHQGRPRHLQGPLIALECTLLDAELLQTTLRDLVRASQEAGLGKGCLLLLNVDQLVESGQQELLNLLSFPQVLFTTIVTTTRPMLELAAANQFLEDLARKLSILSLSLPPLRQRSRDVPEMAHALLQKQNLRRKQPLTGFSDEALQQFVQYPWPQGYEQLLNAVESATLMAVGPWVEVADLPRFVRRVVQEAEDLPWKLEPMCLDEFLAEVEAMLVQQALRQSHGNKTKAAQLLGMTRGTFHRKVDRLDSRKDERGLNDR
jgi:DNA-binding NtrC family response regulator